MTAARLRLARERWPDAVQLARLLCLAVRIEPALVRSARLEAGLAATAEADLWSSGIVRSSGATDLTLDPVAAESLRQELARSPAEDRERAWKLVSSHHGRLPWSIRLEERINYLTAGGAAAGGQPEIDELIGAALAELREVRARDQRAAVGIARWLLAALARAPAAARGTPVAAAAEVAAGLELDSRVADADRLRRAEASDLLPWLLDHLGTTVLPVGLVPGGVIVGGVIVGGVIVGGGAGGAPGGGVPLPVPSTNPLVVTVSWGGQKDERREQLRIAPGEERFVPADTAEVTIRTLAGGGVVLRRAGVGRIWVEGVDRGAAFALSEDAVLTAAHVIGRSAPPDDLGRLSAEYVPDGGQPLSVTVADLDSGLDVALLRPAEPVPAILPVGPTRMLESFQILRPSGRGRPWRSPASGVIRYAYEDGRPEFIVGLEPSFGSEPLLRALDGHSGAAIALENPAGAVVGLLRGVDPVTSRDNEARLLVAPIDAIVERFELEDRITRSTIALIDGATASVQPLGELLELPLREAVLPQVADVTPSDLGFRDEQSRRKVEIDLRGARRSGFVLFTGSPSAVAADVFATIHVQLPEGRLLVPKPDGASLMALASHPDLVSYDEPVIIWLNDLRRYLGDPACLEALVRSRSRGRDHPIMVIGVIAEPDLIELRSPSGAAAGGNLLDEARVVTVRPFPPPPRTRTTTYLADQAIADAEARNSAGRPAEAIELILSAIESSRELTASDPRAYRVDLGHLFLCLSRLYSGVMANENAMRPAAEALGIFRGVAEDNPGRTDSQSDLADALTQSGEILARLQRLNEAIGSYEEAVTLCRRIGDRPRLAEALLGLGETLVQAARPEDAIAVLREAARTAGDLGHFRHQTTALMSLGAVARAARRFEVAIAAYEDAAAVYREIAYRPGEDEALANLRAARAELSSE